MDTPPAKAYGLAISSVRRIPRSTRGAAPVEGANINFGTAAPCAEAWDGRNAVRPPFRPNSLD